MKVIENSWRAEPFKKRLWQNIIRQKIKNQQTVLEKLAGKEFPDFEIYASSVNSGDTLNRGGDRRSRVFSALLPSGLTRKSDDLMNSALNYGYAILRGSLARSIVAYGFLSSFGIKHASELNNFNLADDLIEPYRPILDLLVHREIIPFGTREIQAENELTKRIEQKYWVFSQSRFLDGEQTALHAMEMTAQSLVTATEQKDSELIKLPKILI